MTSREILLEIKNLPREEQLWVVESVAHHLRRHTQGTVEDSTAPSNLALAAAALLPDYQSDVELTAFTMLDGEDIHETR